MTRNEEKFVTEFVVRANARQAYLAAGYRCTPEAAAVAAHRLLHRDDIVSAILAAAPAGSLACRWLESPARSRPIALRVALMRATAPNEADVRDHLIRFARDFNLTTEVHHAP